ncbi:MAG: Viral domain [Acidobacteriota bacterium]|jgi:hypothetical protein|nr:Viral domain [Acidobacteriota bacterium]
MRRALTLLAVLFTLAVARPAAAQQSLCNLQMTLNCTTPAGGTSTCTAVTINAGKNVCSGAYFIGFFSDAPPATATFVAPTNNLGLEDCINTSDFPGQPTEGEDSGIFTFCFGEGSLAPGNSFNSSVQIHTMTGVPAQLSIIAFTSVDDFLSDDEIGSAFAFTTLTPPTCTPVANVAAITQSGVPYTVSWSAASNPQTLYVIEESTDANFTAIVSTNTVQGLSRTFTHDVAQSTTYYYRVRAQNCGGGIGPNSTPVAIVVQSAPAQGARNVDAVVPFGSTTPVKVPVSLKFSASGKTALDNTFTAFTDQPYLTVTPSSGTVPANGVVSVSVTANPATLPPGANTGTVTVTTSSGQTGNLPFSISLVTPVAPGGKTFPPPNTLVIPVITHVNGAAGPFQSDVRLTNAGGSSIDYRINFTPTRTDGTQNGKSTTITVPSGQTIALNDIAKDFFGLGATSDPNDVGFGSLEIRPLNSTASTTFASSRTYATTPEGTFGQYIAATPISAFISNGGGLPLPGEGVITAVSLQQIAQSARFRTNLGLVEGAGQPASGQLRIFDNTHLIKSVPYSLLPGEHQQINNFLAVNGVPNLEDGRIEVTIDSATGAVSAYASVLDNLTTDPLAVMPVQVAAVNASRFVIPGVAELNNGAANFHSDVRIFNGGIFPITANLTFYPQHNPAGAKTTAPLQIAGGEVRALDNIVRTLFNESATGGSIVVTTSSPSSVVATARTYSIGANNGTFGQFIPGVTPDEGIGLGDRALQILQLEQSQNFRSNLGLVELTGQPARVRITLNVPDSRSSPVTELDLAGNEFNQLGSVIASMIPGKNVYNARIAVEVIGGTGRVSGYGSVIDNATQDPTYVPAQ